MVSHRKGPEEFGLEHSQVHAGIATGEDMATVPCVQSVPGGGESYTCTHAHISCGITVCPSSVCVCVCVCVVLYMCVSQQQSKYKVINKDQWCNVLEFSRTINLDLSNYDEDGACESTVTHTHPAILMHTHTPSKACTHTHPQRHAHT